MSNTGIFTVLVDIIIHRKLYFYIIKKKITTRVSETNRIVIATVYHWISAPEHIYGL